MKHRIYKADVAKSLDPAEAPGVSSVLNCLSMRLRSHFLKFRCFLAAATGLLRVVVLLGISLSMIQGCALHYFDEKTGTEHVWGFGYMKMKTTKPNEGLQTVIHGTEVLGLSVGKADKQTYFTAGWNRLESIDILAESTSVRLEWPNSSFVNVRVGSDFPSDPRFSHGSQSQKSISDAKNENKESRP